MKARRPKLVDDEAITDAPQTNGEGATMRPSLDVIGWICVLGYAGVCGLLFLLR